MTTDSQMTTPTPERGTGAGNETNLASPRSVVDQSVSPECPTSVAEHTPAPWPNPDTGMYAWGGKQESVLQGGVLSMADYLHAQKCVNACEGRNDPALSFRLADECVKSSEELRATAASLAARVAALEDALAAARDALHGLMLVVPAAAHHAGGNPDGEDFVVPYTRAEWDALVAATERARAEMQFCPSDFSAALATDNKGNLA